jgi:hypothetical protein
MDPRKWGRDGWKFLYLVTLDFPDKPDFQEIHNYTRFFTYLQYVLPCEVCRIEYAGNLNRIPIEPYLTSRSNAFLWVLKINNLVNKQLGKPPLTREDVMRIYFNNEITVNCQIEPKFWGNDGWKFLFSIAYGYQKSPTYQDIFNYKRFFTYLQYVFPCASYRMQYSNQLNEISINPYLTTSSYLFEWVLKMYNLTNKVIGRPILTRNDIINIYFDGEIISDNPSKTKPNGLALVERFTDGSSHDPHLLNKNVSMALILVVVSYLISQT